MNFFLYRVLYKKTTWAGVAAILTGVMEGISTHDWFTASSKIIAGATAIFARDAVVKITGK